MRLTFKSTYLSIKDFPEIDLPRFTLVTGSNGSGKSHLLRAIQAGNIRTDVAADPKTEVRSFDWANMIPQDSGIFDGQNWVPQRTAVFQRFQEYLRQFGGEILDAGRSFGLPRSHLLDAGQLATMELSELQSVLADPEKSAAAFKAIQEATTSVGQKIRSHLGNQDQLQELDKVRVSANRPIVSLARNDFFSAKSQEWGRADLFQQSLSQLFVAYRDLKLDNQLKQFQQSKGATSVPALSDEEFVKQHMIAPWDFVNDAIRSAGIDFKIDHPDLYRYLPYEPALRKTSSGAQIFFRDLSSGEKVLMSLALCLYYTEDNRQIVQYPKVLLLDEVDAPLHPAMCKTLINVITETLVERHGINVIATTHSPSTVAMAPESALYTVDAAQPGLHKTSKAQCLNILTVGVPTLSISYEGRRQVFVESPTDAKIYGALNDLLKSKLASERSLDFVATGFKSDLNGSHMNTGCATVRHLVQSLAASGNKSVFGLIDWDGCNEPGGRLAVLAHKRRNGLENVLLDPLLIAALVVRNDAKLAEQIGLPKDVNYPAFLNLSPTELQSITDNVQSLVMGRNAGPNVTCNYLGNFELQIDRGYLTVDDHALEGAILNAMPSLKAISRGRSGALMMHIAESILRDQPEFAPIEIFDAFKSLLEMESH